MRQTLEMKKRSLGKLDLFAPGIFGIGQHDPSFLAHRLQAGMDGCRRAEFLFCHHRTHRQPQLILPRPCNDIEDTFFQGIEFRQRG